MTDTNHQLAVLKSYHYLLSLWAINIQDDTVDYFAIETLLMALIEQQDQVSALSLTSKQQQEPEVKSLLISIKAQLLANEQLTKSRVNSNTLGEF